MKNSLTPVRIAAIISKTPKKKFLILDLAPQLIDSHGHVVIAMAMDKQGDISMAVAEVSSYIQAVRDATRALFGTKEADGFGDDEDIEVGEEDGL